jgi:integrase
VEGQIHAGVYRLGADKMTVQQAAESFLEHCSNRHERDERMTRKMLVVYRGHVHNYVLHPKYGLGNRKLSQITTRAVGDFRDALRGAGVSVPTARKILASLHAVLAYAVSQDWLATNAAYRVRVIGARGEGPRRIIPPTKFAIRALLEASDGRVRVMLMFAACTGVRAGEQWAARWSDLDLAAGLLHVRRRVDAYGEEGPPKRSPEFGPFRYRSSSWPV